MFIYKKNMRMKTVITCIAIMLCLGLKAQEQLTNFGNLTVHPGVAVTFFGSFGNNGTFVDSGSAITFKGGGSISGTSVTTVRDMVVNNPLGITLNQSVVVSNTLNLTAGPLLLNSKTITISNPSASGLSRTIGYIVSEATDNSGKLIWNIGADTSTHIYPFGTVTGDYLPFTVKATAGNLGNVSVSTYPTGFDNLPLPSSPIAVASLLDAGGQDNSANTVDRFWQIDKDGPSGTATVTFTATANEVNGMENLQAQRWNSVTQGWDLPLPGQTYNGNTVTVPGISSFSPWTIMGNNNALPVELLYFEANAVDASVQTTWATAIEINNHYFTVERSKNGVDFAEVSRVNGAGNSTVTVSYSYIDERPLQGISYYRLKQTDFDGAFTYSDMQAVNFSAADVVSTVNVYPNPVTGDRFIVKYSNEKSEGDIQLYNAMGQLIAVWTELQGNNSVQVSLPDGIIPGTYILRIKDVAGDISKKISIAAK